MSKFIKISELSKILNLEHPKTKTFESYFKILGKEFKEIRSKKLTIEDIIHLDR